VRRVKRYTPLAASNESIESINSPLTWCVGVFHMPSKRFIEWDHDSLAQRLVLRTLRRWLPQLSGRPSDPTQHASEGAVGVDIVVNTSRVLAVRDQRIYEMAVRDQRIYEMAVRDQRIYEMAVRIQVQRMLDSSQSGSNCMDLRAERPTVDTIGAVSSPRWATERPRDTEHHFWDREWP
jgi:hypothetical protein